MDTQFYLDLGAVYVCMEKLDIYQDTVVTLSIGTPYLLTILVLNLEIVHSIPVDVSKILLYVRQTV